MPLRRSPILCLFAALALVATACGDSTAQGCRTETCTSGVWIHIPLTVPASLLEDAKVAVCRNGECHDWLLPALPAGGEEAFPDAPFLRGALWLNGDQSITLDIEWTLPAPSGAEGIDAGAPPTDGDHYVVTLTPPGGLTSILLDQAATYHLDTPNGPDCPPVCTQAKLAP